MIKLNKEEQQIFRKSLRRGAVKQLQKNGKISAEQATLLLRKIS